MAGSQSLIRINPEYTREVRRLKAGKQWDAQIPTPPKIESNILYKSTGNPSWPVAKTVRLYEVEPWSFTLRSQTIQQLYNWCISKNLSLLEYGYCIVIEQAEDGSEVLRHQACFLFKKLKHALLFKLSWNGITDETGKEL